MMIDFILGMVAMYGLLNKNWIMFVAYVFWFVARWLTRVDKRRINE